MCFKKGTQDWCIHGSHYFGDIYRCVTMPCPIVDHMQGALGVGQCPLGIRLLESNQNPLRICVDCHRKIRKQQRTGSPGTKGKKSKKRRRTQH